MLRNNRRTDKAVSYLIWKQSWNLYILKQWKEARLLTVAMATVGRKMQQNNWGLWKSDSVSICHDTDILHVKDLTRSQGLTSTTERLPILHKRGAENEFGTLPGVHMISSRLLGIPPPPPLSQSEAWKEWLKCYEECRNRRFCNFW